ncbi:MAG: acetylglutamate kinase [Candidatus Methanogranum gryphiswaldense]|nr:MAG: acetylglutamate kinase [Candidatus Methanogranum sp. U3.2.1]
MKNIYVLKFGGNAIRGKEDMMRLSNEIAQLIHDGAKIILVHGGGPEISEEMERRGMTPKKVGGVRVTDADALDVAEDVLRKLNADVVECLIEASIQALGCAGYTFTLCEKKAPYTVMEGGQEVTVDLGLVGEVSDVDVDSIFDLLKAGITPVIYPIGKDALGNKLNVNADTMASGIAAGVKCKEMITITDVPGILTDINDPSSKIDKLTLKEVDELIASGVISGGMIPKVEACRNALNAGVQVVRMVNGKDKRSIVTDIMKNVPHGTIILK